MRICVFGIEGISAEDLLSDERLLNLRHLMDLGTYGLIHDVKSDSARSVWKIMATGRRSVGELPIAEQAIWDVVASAGGESSGGNSILAGLPPDVAGPSESIEVRLDSTEETVHIEPANVAEEVRVALGGSAESRGTFAEEKDPNRITGGKQWSIVRWLLQKKQWKYLHMVDAGASRWPAFPSNANEQQSASIRDAGAKQPDY